MAAFKMGFTHIKLISKFKHHRKSHPKDVLAPTSVDAEDEDFRDEDGDEDDDENDDAELDALWEERRKLELPSEFWQIKKLLKYAKNGNPTVTILTLCTLRDFDLHQDICQRAILEDAGVELLLNILDSEEQRCKVAALKILVILTKVSKCRRVVIQLDGIRSLVNILKDTFCEVKSLAASTLANLIKQTSSAASLIELGGIERLVSLLDLNRQKELQLDIGRQIGGDAEVIQVVQCSALALEVLSRASIAKQHLYDSGVVPLIAHLLKIPAQPEVLTPTVNMLQECSSEGYFRQAIFEEGIIVQLIENINPGSNPLLMSHCANTILKCAVDADIRNCVRLNDGLRALVTVLSKCEPNNPREHRLLRALTGALWQCSVDDPENVAELQKLKIVDKLLSILAKETHEEVLKNVMGCLAECVTDKASKSVIAKKNSVPLMIKMLTKPNKQLLVNICNVLIRSCSYSHNMKMIEQEDGIRYLWSLLKYPDPEVQASAAEAIHACLDETLDRKPIFVPLGQVRHLLMVLYTGGYQPNAATAMLIYPQPVLFVAVLFSPLTNRGPALLPENLAHLHKDSFQCNGDPMEITNLVRNFVGGLELLVSLLSSPYHNVQASACGVIAVVAKNMDNLAVITDNGAVAYLAKLASNCDVDARLQRYIAEAIANCCALRSNIYAFGTENAVAPLVSYLKSSDIFVCKMAAKALALLSKHSANCLSMRQNDAVKMLLLLIGSSDEDIQENAATALWNIRKVASYSI